MGKLPKLSYYHLILLLLAVKGTSRPLLYASSSGLISDGTDDRVESNQTSIDLLLKGGVDYYVSSEEEEEEECEQLYGFLPCSYSAAGHLFLIVVYEYLLFHGESYVASGGERIFKILGPGIFGASAFQVIGSLPEALILLASGLLNSKETAQEYVYTGVGLLAGSTILLLTVLWGTCVIVASTNFSNDQNSDPSVNSSPGHNPFWRFLSFLTDYGITADVESLETSYMARIMLISVIPLIIIQIPTVFHFSSSEERILIIITLVISVSFLLSYFVYQVFQPWIQKRRLEFVKHEHLVLDILRHVQKHALGRLLTADGAPNVTAIRRLFEEVDQDGDKILSLTELRKLFHGIKYERWHAHKDRAVDVVMKIFDTSGDKKITVDEFVIGITKWLEEMKLSAEKQYHSIKSLKELYEILQPLIQKKKKEHEELISEVLGHVQSSAIGSLYMENGRPNIPIIRRLFEGIDLDKDNCISQSELRQLVGDIKFRNVSLDSDEVVDRLMEELDLSGDQMINEEEFVTGVSKWLHASRNQAPTPTSTEAPNETYQKKWEETDLLVEGKPVDRSLWAWMKAIMLLVAGIAILAVLAEPLIESVQSFSESATLPSFFISFILVPLATNARGAISAITAARRKKPRTTSLTFSEIYGGVFMNNVLGLTVLLSLVYFRGLSWEFSAEVLIVLIVCAIMGVATSFSSTFPIWTSLVAYLLYPLSLILVYVLDDFFNWS
ncbi:sodium/calcium exchanger NCL1-like [Rhododendron vialii]|uniref:sodium/calcium exchanger NCL1-like n=1 Tax=Rhododendron vialii TaxID=182163 RepID=UPI00265E9518|nr:sodium/calcium exchanger NCL1-like [Rhododendron vialii]